MKIEEYDFGVIVVDGKRFTNDIIIFPDHIQTSWWRKEGHLLQVEDLKEVFENPPKTLIVGTGHSGIMAVDQEVRNLCVEKEILLIEKKSGIVVDIYNSIHEKEDVVLAIHLTC